jgi:hypothetical protein
VKPVIRTESENQVTFTHRLVEPIKRTKDYRFGYASGVATVADKGLDWARGYGESKLTFRNNLTPKPIIDYWDGYLDAVVSQAISTP